LKKKTIEQEILYESQDAKTLKERCFFLNKAYFGLATMRRSLNRNKYRSLVDVS